LRLGLNDREGLGVGVRKRLGIGDWRLIAVDDDLWLRWFRRWLLFGRWFRLGLEECGRLGPRPAGVLARRCFGWRLEIGSGDIRF
jgi:hypothetical protein